MNAPVETPSMLSYQHGDVPLTALVNFPGQLPMMIHLQKGACSYADLTAWQQNHGRICNGTQCRRQGSVHCALSHQINYLVDLFRNIHSYTVGTLIVQEVGYATKYCEEDAQTIFFRLLWLTVRNAISAYFGHNADQLVRLITTTVPDLESLLGPMSETLQTETISKQSQDRFAGQITGFIETLKNVYHQIDTHTFQHGDCCRNGWTILWNIFLLVEFSLAFSRGEVPTTER